MRTLSANTAAAVDRPHAAPIVLVQIAFSSPSSLTLYLCSRPFSPRNTFDGHVYDPIILSFSEIRSGEIDFPFSSETRAGDFNLDVMNTVPVGGHDRMTELLNAYAWAFAEVTASLVYEGALDTGDDVAIFKGHLENLANLSPEKVTLEVSDFVLSFKDKWPHVIVTTDDYANADPDDVGKMLPQVWGACKRVPFRAVDAGAMTTLAEDLAASATGAKKFTDVSLFPSSGTVMVDGERMTYTAKSDSANTLTISARGQGGTDNVDHVHGAAAAEIQSEYFYLIGHAVKTINTVYALSPDGVWVKQATGDYTAYTGQSGDEHASYPGKACIKFTSKPLMRRATVEDGVGVSDTITAIPVLEKTVYSIDGDIGSVVSGTTNISANQAYWTPSLTFTNSQNGYMIECDVNVSVGSLGTKWRQLTIEGDVVWRCDNGIITVNALPWRITSANDYPGGSIDFIATSESGFDGSVSFTIAAVTMTFFEYQSADIKGGSASKTGTVHASGNSSADFLIGTQVAADVDGYQDDGSGTYTGTPNALIQRADHVFKHWIIAMLGLSSAEIDSTTYTASGSSYGGANQQDLNACLLEPPEPGELFGQAAMHVRSVQAWEAGIHHLVYVLANPTTHKTLSGMRLDLDSVQLEFTLRAQVGNDLTATYDKHWSGYDDETEANRAIVAANDATSIAKYGTIQKEFAFDFIADDTRAQAALNFIRNRLCEPMLMVTVTGDPSLLDIERGDWLEFDTDESELNDALLGLVAPGDQFLVLGKNYLPDFRQEILMIRD